MVNQLQHLIYIYITKIKIKGERRHKPKPSQIIKVKQNWRQKSNPEKKHEKGKINEKENKKNEKENNPSSYCILPLERAL